MASPFTQGPLLNISTRFTGICSEYPGLHLCVSSPQGTLIPSHPHRAHCESATDALADRERGGGSVSRYRVVRQGEQAEARTPPSYPTGSREATAWRAQSC
jgi:hypothetical protein